ncbi:MAG: rhomboid family intramembrane serine protease [Candidatus Brocadiia bacterium]
MQYHGERGYGGWGGGIGFPRAGSTVKTLIIINVAIFVLQALLGGRVRLAAYLGVRADLVVEHLWVWQVFTYMFLHSLGHLFHIIMNMLLLYWFGTELERLLGRRRFLMLYLGGGVVGGLAYCLTQYLARSQQPAIGASAAVMALLVVYAIHFPNRTILLFFLIPMTIKWFVIMILGIDLLYSLTSYHDGVAHTAHLGGALFGFLFWRHGRAVEDFFARLQDRAHEREATQLADDEKRMDEILAKISREGFDSLTRRERQFLEDQSRKRRDRGYRG